MEEFILDDGYVSQGTTAVKPIKYVLGGENGECFICVSHSSQKTGYYRMKRFGKHIDMHVWINDVFNGEKSKVGFVVRHLCHNSRCINPNHLKVGTYSENESDKFTAGNGVFGDRHPHSVLTEKDVYEIKHLMAYTTIGNKDIADIYGVSKATIKQIRDLKTWTHVLPNFILNSVNYIKLNEEKVRDIKAKLSDGYEIKDLALIYNVNQNTIYSIKQGKTWSMVRI
jgi:hypothetical protein